MEPLGPTEREALASLRSYASGVLLYADRALPVRFVLDPASGRLVMPLPGDAFDANEHILHLPDEADPSLELLLSLAEPSPGASAAAERWRAYHGDPLHARWAIASIDSARMAGMIYDGPALMRPNPLAPDQPRICRALNADPARLADICAASTHTRPERPVALGADPDGLDARARFGVIRVAFPRPADSADDALAILEELARQGSR